MRKCVCLVVGLFLSMSSFLWAAQGGKALTTDDIGRLRALKQLIGDVDDKTLQQTIKEVEKTGHPKIQLQLREAMAKTYVDIVKEQGVQGQKKRQWLYSMIALNMAYLQFGGDKDSAGGVKNLNKLIRQKLKKYLPTDIYQQRGFLTSLG